MLLRSPSMKYIILFSLLLTTGLLFARERDIADIPDPEYGEKNFLQCQVCHTVARNDPGWLAPSLRNLIGRPCQAIAEFGYSPDYQKACENGRFRWTEENLDSYLKDPSAFLSEQAGEAVNARMMHTIDNVQDRADLIEYLKRLTR